MRSYWAWSVLKFPLECDIKTRLFGSFVQYCCRKKKKIQSHPRNTTHVVGGTKQPKWHKVYIIHKFLCILFAVRKTKQVISSHTGIDSPLTCCAHCKCSGLVFPRSTNAGFEGPQHGYSALPCWRNALQNSGSAHWNGSPLIHVKRSGKVTVKHCFAGQTFQ